MVLGLLLLTCHLPLLASSSSAGEYEEDFVHSFLHKPEKLVTSGRLERARDTWLRSTPYQVRAIGW